jgi:valyl-tRNA synthetase
VRASDDGAGRQTVPSAPERVSARTAREAQRRQARAAERRAQALERTEAAITAKEAEMSTLAAVINQTDFYLRHDNPQALFSQYARLQKEIDTLYAELEKLERAKSSAAAS